jgi:hypothetical protein
MERVQAADGKPALDGPLRDADLDELPASHDAMLISSEGRQRSLPRPTPYVSDFLRHMWRQRSDTP